ncbi:MAG: prepilin-type N-terminal cleavage/methylation domain-containing protein [Phycisphaeraceae bacterium]|nr:prepilin-type N-terminal cleavage/methylation domain-containing protein [Phycisphaeraceae bacterium]
MVLHRHHTRRRALTLVELLVVIAIIVVIGAMVCYALWKLYKAVKTMFTRAEPHAVPALVWAGRDADPAPRAITVRTRTTPPGSTTLP